MSRPYDATSTDRELLDAVATPGGEHAFRLLYRRHTPALLRSLEWRLQDPSVIEDAAQDVWVIAMTRRSVFRWESSYRTWLLGIGANVARSEGRRNARSQLPTSEPTGARVDHELRIDLRKAIEQLPGGQREVFMLHDVEGFTHAEIAGRLGVTCGTSKSQLHHARSALREQLSRGESHAHR
jgi:RNA polymerase sigma-70 factor (ECF subfamily)